MTLALHYHPLSSFCHKILIALYENDTPFEKRHVDFGEPQSRARFFDLWAMGKIPVLRDEARDRTVPETTIILEYLQLYYPGAVPLLPLTPDERLEARLWDRFFDLYVQVPMQKIVGDRLRSANERDPRGVADAAGQLQQAYGVIEQHMTGKQLAAGTAFSIADCAAAPALFYAGIVQPFAAKQPNTAGYFERLLQRPSFRRVLIEAEPFFESVPFQEAMPARFRGMTQLSPQA